MRLILHLAHNPNSLLPLNYNYHISSWIYKTLNYANPQLAQWLHQKGFESNGKKYKLFTFGHIRPERFDIDKTHQVLQLKEGPSQLEISFWVDEYIQHFIYGLFEKQAFQIGNAFIKSNFQVQQIQIQDSITFQEVMRWRCRMPICISFQEAGDKYAKYLSPTHPKYSTLLESNLRRKLEATGILLSPYSNFQFRLLNAPQSKLIQIKESQIRGFQFDFELDAPVALQKMAYYAGFGEKNAQGFGLVGPLK